MISSKKMIELIGKLSADPTFEYQKRYFEEARRLRAAGFIEGPEGYTTLTKEGIEVCMHNAIATPAEHARIRELKRKRDNAIAILSRKTVPEHAWKEEAK